MNRLFVVCGNYTQVQLCHEFFVCLLAKGWRPVSVIPLYNSNVIDFDCEQVIQVSFALLNQSHYAFFMPHWEESLLAQREMKHACKLGLFIYTDISQVPNVNKG